MADANIVRLVNGLIEKTTSGELDWEKTDADRVFAARFKNYSVEIASSYEFDESLGEPDENIVIRVLDSNNDLVETINFGDFDQYELTGEEYPWKAFKALYESARRRALGMDKAILSIVGELYGDELSA